MKIKTCWRSMEVKAVLQHLVKLQKFPEESLTEGVSIDDYATWRTTRFTGLEDGVKRRVENS